MYYTEDVEDDTVYSQILASHHNKESTVLPADKAHSSEY
jgi:hypothetical protein